MRASEVSRRARQIDDQIVELLKDQLRPSEIMTKLGLTKHAYHSRTKRMREQGRYVPQAPRGYHDEDAWDRLTFYYCKTVERDPSKASEKHLKDLEAAGHDPRRTEYVITTERPYAPRNYGGVYGSLTGSSAAMCAEEGSKAGALGS